MGRQFEARKHTMMKRWDRMAKAFTRVGREISIAVRAGGPEPDNNPALRRAIQNGRAANMPKDKIESAIAKALGGDTADYKEVLYEGYAPHGVPLMVVTATDNTTRTVANVRMHFSRGGGNLGNSGAVGFLFERMGVFKLKPEDVEDRDELELMLIDHGLETLEDGTDDEGNDVLVLYCAWTDFGQLQGGLEEAGIEPLSTGLEYIPLSTQELDEAQVDDVLALIDRLEQDDDVQAVFHNLA